MLSSIPDTVWQSLIAAIVTISLALIQRNNKKIDDLTKVAKDTHTLVNSNYGMQLKIGALALRRIANLTNDTQDSKDAEAAEKSLEDHNKAQAIVDNIKETA